MRVLSLTIISGICGARFHGPPGELLQRIFNHFISSVIIFKNFKAWKDHENKAAVARWMMRKNEWGSIATISTLESMKGQPFSNVISFNEGLEGVSTGVPYFFITDLDQQGSALSAWIFKPAQN